MEKVVYILGAGFSAPLGLPVMSNFYRKAKDLYTNDPKKFAYFKEVFDIVDKLSKSKNYYKTDLFNIEEILSILEFQTSFGSSSANKRRKELFTKFIKDVIEHYTPTLPEKEIEILLPVIGRYVNGGRDNWGRYGAFVATIMGLNFNRTRGGYGEAGVDATLLAEEVEHKTSVQYAVISLNYDLILEQAIQRLNNILNRSDCFYRSLQNEEDGIWCSYLAKLHGSIDANNIVPPTWNKNLNKSILSEWKLAYKLLSEANHIRILGYSLPSTDNYIKYLLRAASIQSLHLKQIDIICLDPDKSVKKRYDDFIDYSSYRFGSLSIDSYLEYHQNNLRDNSHDPLKLEMTHSGFFQLHNIT